MFLWSGYEKVNIFNLLFFLKIQTLKNCFIYYVNNSYAMRAVIVRFLRMLKR